MVIMEPPRRAQFRLRHFLREIVPNLAKVVGFKEGPQLWRPKRDETKGLILSHCFRQPSRRTRRTLRSPTTLALVPAGPTVQDAFPILNIVVPHSPQLPRVAARPFFIVTGWPFWISRLSRHFMQYPVIGIVPSFLTSQSHAGAFLSSGKGHRSIETGTLHGLAYLVARIRRHRTFCPTLSRGVLGTFQERERPSASPSRPI